MAVNLDQKQPGFPAQVLPQYLESIGVPYHIIEQDTYRVVKRVMPEGRTMCSLCSRLRRGALYRFAAENGISKIALGHHRDDIVETLFLNLFHGGRLKAMAPKLRSDDGRHIVIRPLAYIAERDIARYARGMALPADSLHACAARSRICSARRSSRCSRAGSASIRGACESIFSALRHVEPQTLADTRLFDFAALRAQPRRRRRRRRAVGHDLRLRASRASAARTATGCVPGSLLAGEYPVRRRSARDPGSACGGCCRPASTPSST